MNSTKRTLGYGAFGLTLIAAAAGCTATPRNLPTGEWAGQGTCTLRKTEGANQTCQTEHYPIRVTVRNADLDGQPLQVITVLSEHSEVLGGKDVHLAMILTEPRPLASGSVVYQTHGHLDMVTTRPSPVEPGEPQIRAMTKEDTLALVQCFRLGQATVLQVYYDWSKSSKYPTFFESFTFSGDQLTKSGYQGDINESIVWVEQLRKVGP